MTDKKTQGKAICLYEADMQAVESHGIAEGTAVIYTIRSPEKDTPNEDSVALIPFDEKSAVLVVADGLGGIRGGEKASKCAIETLRKTLGKALEDEVMLRTAVLNSIENANQAVLDTGIGAATTLAAVEISDNVIRPYHVGDSMILCIGQRGQIKLHTVSHSPVGFAVESGMLDEEEAMYHKERHLVSNVIGLPEMRIEVGPHVVLAKYDTVLVGSDGLFDNLNIDEIVEMLRKGPIEKGAARLAEEARRRMTEPKDGEPSKPDDLAFVVYRRA
jgi:serine/threonine protein phosphatase PrpC